MNNFIAGCIAVCIAMAGFAVVIAIDAINDSIRRLIETIEQNTNRKLEIISNRIEKGSERVSTNIGGAKEKFWGLYDSTNDLVKDIKISSQESKIKDLEKENDSLWEKYNAEVRKNAPKEETHD